MEKLNPVDQNAATLVVGSDRYPYTVIKRTENKVWCRRDDYMMAEGGNYFGDQKYDYYERPDASVEEFTLRKNGHWCRVGDGMNGCALVLGYRRAYQDPSF